METREDPATTDRREDPVRMLGPATSTCQSHRSASARLFQDHLDPQDLVDQMGHLDSQETAEATAVPDPRDLLDHPDSPATQETQDPKGHPDPQESSAPPHRPPLAAQDSQDAQEPPVPQEREEDQETTDAQGTQDSRETEDAQDSPDAQETQGLQESQGTQGHQEAATTAHLLVWLLAIRRTSRIRRYICSYSS